MLSLFLGMQARFKEGRKLSLIKKNFALMYSRRQYKVSVMYRSVPVYRPYRTSKKRLARPYHFILLGVTQYYCYTRSEYRAESSSMWSFLVCLLLLFFPPVSYSAVPLHSVDCFCFSCRLKASLLACFALVRRLFLLF